MMLCALSISPTLRRQISPGRTARQVSEALGELDADGSHATTPRGALQIVLSAFFDMKVPKFHVEDGDPRMVMAFRAVAMAQAIGSQVITTHRF